MRLQGRRARGHAPSSTIGMMLDFYGASRRAARTRESTSAGIWNGIAPASRRRAEGCADDLDRRGFVPIVLAAVLDRRRSRCRADEEAA